MRSEDSSGSLKSSLRRSFKALVLVVSSLSLVGLVACGIDSDQAGDVPEVRSIAQDPKLNHFEREINAKSYYKPREIMSKEREDIVEKSNRYRSGLVKSEHEEFERNLYLMQDWLREDFKAITSKNGFKSISQARSRLLELNLTEREKERVNSLLKLEGEKHAKIFVSLLQPALASFDDLYRAKLKQLSILEGEAILETRIFLARIQLFDASRYDWRFGRELALYLFGFKWLWGMFTGYKPLTFTASASEDIAKLEASLAKLRAENRLKLDRLNLEYALALKRFNSIFVHAEGLSPLKRISSSLRTIRELLPDLLKRLDSGVKLLHDRERLRQRNYVVVLEALESRVTPQRWSFVGGGVNSIFKNVVSYQLTNSPIGFNNLSELLNGKQLTSDDFSVQAIDGGKEPEIPLKLYQKFQGTVTSYLKEQGKIWPQFPFGNELPLNQSLETILAPWLGVNYTNKDLFFASRDYNNIFLTVLGSVLKKSQDGGEDRIRELWDTSLMKQYQNWKGLNYDKVATLENFRVPGVEASLRIENEDDYAPTLPQVIPSDGPLLFFDSLLKEIPKLRDEVSKLFLTEGITFGVREIDTKPVVKELVVNAKLALISKIQILEERRDLANLLKVYTKVRASIGSSTLKELLLFTLGFKWLWGLFTGYSKTFDGLARLLEDIIGNLRERLAVLDKQLLVSEKEYRGIYDSVLARLRAEVNDENNDLSLRDAYSSYASKFVYVFSEYDSAASSYNQAVSLFREFERNASESYSQFANLSKAYASGFNDGSDAAALVNVASDARRRINELNEAKLRFVEAAKALEDFIADNADPSGLVKAWQEGRKREFDSYFNSVRDRLTLKVLGERALASSRFGRLGETGQIFDKLDWDSSNPRVFAYDLVKRDKQGDAKFLLEETKKGVVDKKSTTSRTTEGEDLTTKDSNGGKEV